MDPISAIGVASSVAGLLALGGKMISLVSKITSVNDAPDLARAVLAEMSDISAALRHVQDFLNGVMVVPIQRRQYILVEHLVATLTGCVTAYSELEAIVDKLGIGASAMRVYDRTRWALKENEIQGLLRRLQNHKSSLNLMLTILQCTSNHEIEQSVMRLCSLVEEAVMSNDNLSVRLSRLEGGRSPAQDDAEGVSTYDNHDDNSDSATIQPINTVSINAPAVSNESFTIRFDFDRDLMVSRVYRRANFVPSDSHSESSLTGSARRLAAFSIFSSQSLAEISNLSVYSLPICLGDISNSNWYIDAAAGQLPGENNGLKVLINTLGGRKITITLSSKSTCEDLKRKIHERRAFQKTGFTSVLHHRWVIVRIVKRFLTTLYLRNVEFKMDLYYTCSRTAHGRVFV